jgi:hypothetical protein
MKAKQIHLKKTVASYGNLRNGKQRRHVEIPYEYYADIQVGDQVIITTVIRCTKEK